MHNDPLVSNKITFLPKEKVTLATSTHSLSSEKSVMSLKRSGFLCEPRTEPAVGCSCLIHRLISLKELGSGMSFRTRKYAQVTNNSRVSTLVYCPEGRACEPHTPTGALQFE